MLRTRVLPHDEWDRLEGTDLGQVRAQLPDNVTVIVVEDDEEIVGTWALVPVLHAEGVWIAPRYRGAGSVARRLLHGLSDVAQAQGAGVVMTGAEDDTIANYLTRVGAQRVPFAQYVMPVMRPKE